MNPNRLAMMREDLTARVEWRIEDDARPWVTSHALFPIALLTEGDAHWVQRIADELGLGFSIVKGIIDEELQKV